MTCGGGALGDEWLHMTPPPFWLDVLIVDESWLLYGFDDGGSSLSGWLVMIEGLVQAFTWMWHCLAYFRA
jgi:hypothetical protein